MRLSSFRVPILAVLVLLMSCNQPDDGPGPSIETDVPSIKPDVPAVEDVLVDIALDADGKTVEVDADSTPDLFGEGGFGWPCESEDECREPFCLAGTEGMECSFPCASEGDCPQGYKCLFLAGAGMVCQSLFTNLCRPCFSDEDCGPMAFCLGDETSGHYCGGDCSDGFCPNGFMCSEVAEADDEPDMQCLPKDGECECGYWPLQDEATTGCLKENEWGVCPGQRTCLVKALTPCDAHEPAEETCNGTDDDCDGSIDEDQPEVECGVGPCQHAEPGCVDGVLAQCNPLAGSEDEICNGIDDDCDGMTDEELVPVICGLGLCEHEVPACLEGAPNVCDPLEGMTDESCDGLDNDCDGETDEELPTTGCGNGICYNEVVGCTDGVPTECTPLPLENTPEACNGIDDNCDGVADDGFTDTDGDLLADCVDPDDDNDTVDDEVDNCPLVANEKQSDKDNDGYGDKCDDGCWLGDELGWESDCDGIPDSEDNCPAVFNDNQSDNDEDSLGDACDEDDDNDLTPDATDNCPFLSNPDQEDLDKDNIGDLCDTDKDGDLFIDSKDNCPMIANPGQADTDKDQQGDACDEDDDGDGDPDETDCAPLNPAINHDVAEACNNKDDNCDGQVDEEGAVKCQTWYLDSDQDGYGIVEDSKCLCLPEAPYSTKETGDCSPDDLEIHPGVEELCNGQDDNCDDQVDEGYPDLDNNGTADCLDDDDDGDGVPDLTDNCPQTPNDDQSDLDKDDLGDLCDPDIDGDEVPNAEDCGPENALRYPGNVETCDGLDNDCNDVVDDGLGETTCGKGICEHTVSNCADGSEQICDPEEGKSDEVCDLLDNDCNGDTDENMGTTTCGKGECEHTIDNCLEGVPQECDEFEGATDETCDLLDNDCDGEIDEELGSLDCGTGVCKHPVVNCINGVEQECDPFLGQTTETCDLLDNDCDGEVDEDLGTTDCGLGECDHTVENCLDGKEVVCDPMEGEVEEICDGLDNNCNGDTDEIFPDFDEDDLPDCLDPDDDNDNVLDEADCNDFNDTAYPGGTEVCDDVDNDCNGVADEGCPDVVTGTSCLDIHDSYPDFESGDYTVDPDGNAGLPAVEVYCDMELDGGGWMRIADVDSKAGQCPGAWVLTNLPQVCFRLTGSGCKSATFPNHGIPYSEVRGFVKAYQFYSMDAFHMGNPKNIDGNYVDGLSITYGAGPRKHVWTYAVGLSQDANYGNNNCPCAKYPGGKPTFVGNHYYCESGNPGGYENTWYTADLLFDGSGCPAGNSCCNPADLPWFHRDFGNSLNQSMEARLCSDQTANTEDIGVTRMELYIR